MSRKMFAIGLFATAVVGVASFSPEFAGTAFGQKKQEPIKTDELFKKLDANKDKALDLEEFQKLFSVQPEPKAKKGKEPEKFDLTFIFKSLDADGNKTLSAEEFKGVIGAIYPPPKK
jgi:Ca2+-binding EF-hand superfamily protein